MLIFAKSSHANKRPDLKGNPDFQINLEIGMTYIFMFHLQNVAAVSSSTQLQHMKPLLKEKTLVDVTAKGGCVAILPIWCTSQLLLQFPEACAGSGHIGKNKNRCITPANKMTCIMTW